MFRLSLCFLFAAGIWAQPKTPQIGRPATADELKKLDLTIFPDGRGLPPGKGNAVRGRIVYKEKCAVCHNDNGEGREDQYPALVGGIGSLATR